jgi:hypothetical protein
MMGFCIGQMGWTARRFMDSTPHEIFAAFEWWKSVNCVNKED